MKHEIIVPAAGESVTEADIADWSQENGTYVERDAVLLELETDKASLELNAEHAGILTILISEGTVKVGVVLGYITPSERPDNETSTPKETQVVSPPVATPPSAQSSRPVPQPAPVSEPPPEPLVSVPTASPPSIPPSAPTSQPTPKKPGERREKMSRMRRTIASRLVDVQQTSALLTTFNEVDMSAVMALRSSHKESFKDEHGIGLGFMSFFTKAACSALLDFPLLNATIDNGDIIYHDFCDIGIAVSTPKGLVVPVLRHAEKLSFAEIEKAIKAYALKGRDGKLTIDEMAGGTFTITNGGVFGSMLSTPIVNQPQSAILGMHNIVKRPVAVDGNVVIRPIMYLAVSYDHRLIDGSAAVQFLVHIKDQLEDPSRLLIEL